jgi:hypothetical protein
MVLAALVLHPSRALADPWESDVADPGLAARWTALGELEVFALIARANDDVHAFSILAMVVSLFEPGYLRTGAGPGPRPPADPTRPTGRVPRPGVEVPPGPRPGAGP